MDFIAQSLLHRSLLHDGVGAASDLSSLHAATRPFCIRTVLFVLSALRLSAVWFRSHSVRRHQLASAESAVAILRHTVRQGISRASSSQGTSDVYPAQAQP